MGHPGSRFNSQLRQPSLSALGQILTPKLLLMAVPLVCECVYLGELSISARALDRKCCITPVGTLQAASAISV